MPIVDSNLTTILIIISVSFVLLLIGVVVTYFWLVRKYLKLQEEQTEKKIKEAEQASKVIQDAHNEAKKILAEANDRAQMIVSDSKAFREDQDASITQALEQANQLYLQSYREMLKEVQSQSVEVFQNISKDVKGEMASEIGEFRKYLHQELSSLSEGAKEEIGKIYERAAQEAEVYKKARLKKIDESIMDIVQIVSRELIGKELSADQHEELVIQALETAKKEKMFVSDSVSEATPKAQEANMKSQETNPEPESTQDGAGNSQDTNSNPQTDSNPEKGNSKSQQTSSQSLEKDSGQPSSSTGQQSSASNDNNQAQSEKSSKQIDSQK